VQLLLARVDKIAVLIREMLQVPSQQKIASATYPHQISK